jgi:multiple sugar transport system permease protein
MPTQTVLERRYALLGLLLIAPTVLVFCAVIVYPLVSAIYLSLFKIFTPTLEGTGSGWTTTRSCWRSGEFWTALGTTLIWTVGTLTLQIVFGVGMALVLHQNIWFRSAGAQPDPVSLLHLHRGRGAGLALAVQRPLRHPEPPDDVAG